MRGGSVKLGLFCEIFRRRGRRIRFGGKIGRFLRIRRGAEALELMERAVKRALDAGFVAEQVFDGAGAAGVVEEGHGAAAVGLEAGEVLLHARGEIGHAEIEQAGFDAAEAGEAPGGHDHLVDQKIFGWGGGLVLGAECFGELVEILLIFIFENGGLGGEAVAQGVEADGGEAFGSARAGAQLSVAAVGDDLV